MDRYPEQLPYDLKKYKSSSHIVLSHEAVEFVLKSQISKTIFGALHDYNSPEESFFAVLQFNQKSNFPGSLPVENATRSKNLQRTRFVEWIDKKNSSCVSGKVQRRICILGVKHLSLLTRKAYPNYLAANKFVWGFQPLAWDCMYLWQLKKVEQEYQTQRVSRLQYK